MAVVDVEDPAGAVERRLVATGAVGARLRPLDGDRGAGGAIANRHRLLVVHPGSEVDDRPRRRPLERRLDRRQRGRFGAVVAVEAVRVTCSAGTGCAGAAVSEPDSAERSMRRTVPTASTAPTTAASRATTARRRGAGDRGERACVSPWACPFVVPRGPRVSCARPRRAVVARCRPGAEGRASVGGSIGRIGGAGLACCVTDRPRSAHAAGRRWSGYACERTEEFQ